MTEFTVLTSRKWEILGVEENTPSESPYFSQLKPFDRKTNLKTTTFPVSLIPFSVMCPVPSVQGSPRSSLRVNRTVRGEDSVVGPPGVSVSRSLGFGDARPRPEPSSGRTVPRYGLFLKTKGGRPPLSQTSTYLGVGRSGSYRVQKSFYCCPLYSIRTSCTVRVLILVTYVLHDSKGSWVSESRGRDSTPLGSPGGLRTELWSTSCSWPRNTICTYTT